LPFRQGWREHQLACQLRMPNRDLQRDRSAMAEAEEIRGRDLEVAKQSGDIVGRTLERARLIAIGRASVSLLLECTHAAVAGKEREDSAEVRVDRRAAAVKEHERGAVMAAM